MAFLMQRSTNSLLSRTISGNGNVPIKVRNSRHESNQTPSGSTRKKDPEELPRFSLKDLGMSPGVKIIVYGALTVIGTAETITYGSWAYNKLYPKDENVAEE